jgi:hypothetical protein
MNNINMGRVVLGGLVAGLVLNVGEVVLNDLILGAQMKSFFAQHNLAEPGTNFMIAAVGLTFVMGIVLVLGYACIRTRCGPGPKTAACAGLFGWFAVYVYSGIINGILFGITPATMALVIVFGLVEYSLAALAGASLYKEA